MDLTSKQRRIIRLAFSSKNPDLRRKAVDQILIARYTQEFKDWADGQDQAFTHPETGNKVRFNSLPSQAQGEVYHRYDSGGYHDRGGPAEGGAGGQAPAPARAPEGDRGQQHQDRKELRGKAKKKMEDKTDLGDEDLGQMLPLDKLSELPQGMGDRIKDGLKKASYHDLEALYESTKYIAANPEDEYSKNHWLTKTAGLNTDDIKKLHKGLGKKLDEAKGRKYSQAVLGIANNNDLEGIDADAMWQFRKDKPAHGRQLTPEQLKQKFLEGPWGRDPETRERVRQMSPDEFMAMRNAIFDEEEEELEFAQQGQGGHQASSKLQLFDRPPGLDAKKARLTVTGRKIVRMAFHSTDPEVRRKLVRRARAEMS